MNPYKGKICEEWQKFKVYWPSDLQTGSSHRQHHVSQSRFTLASFDQRMCGFDLCEVSRNASSLNVTSLHCPDD